jgi:hypothetical protein
MIEMDHYHTLTIGIDLVVPNPIVTSWTGRRISSPVGAEACGPFGGRGGWTWPDSPRERLSSVSGRREKSAFSVKDSRLHGRGRTRDSILGCTVLVYWWVQGRVGPVYILLVLRT